MRDIYLKELLRKGEFSKEETDAIFNEFEELLNQAFEDAKSSPALEVTDKMLDRSEESQKERDSFPDTTFPLEDLKEIAVKLNTVPKNFDAIRSCFASLPNVQKRLRTMRRKLTGDLRKPSLLVRF